MTIRPASGPPSRVAALSALAAAGMLAVPTATAGPVWISDLASDAGELPADAQVTTGSGSLDAIRGKTSATAGPAMPDLVDMYLIRICDPEQFRASMLVSDGGFAEFDPQLFLFTFGPPLVATGLLSNDDADDGVPESRLVGFSNDGSGAFIDAPGRYWLAVSIKDRDPANRAGRIFGDLGDPTQISGPDGPGGEFPLTAWVSQPQSKGGNYLIALEGTSFGGGPNLDCNRNGLVDTCDIALGISEDRNGDGIPDECDAPCQGDVDGNGAVDFDDLLQTIASFGPCPPGPCPGDWNGNSVLDFEDLLVVLAAWGPCPG